MHKSNGPDFLCIGVAKAGTGWMYDQLACRTDFWMPPIKEIRYLHVEKPNLKRAGRRLQKLQENSANSKSAETSGNGNRAAMDKDFLQQLALLQGKKRNVKRYGEIFRSKGNCLTGDITPKYCMMEDEIFHEVIQHFPNIKIILFLRDPVARTWSHLAMFHRKGLLNDNDLLQPDQFRQTLERPLIVETIKRGMPAQIARRWQAIAPNESLRIFFFDDIANNPDQTIQTLIEFLGANPSKAADLPPSFNRKANLSKLNMPDSIQEILVEQLSDELRAARTELGGHAHTWAKRYGL
jgi:hypothetical protein